MVDLRNDLLPTPPATPVSTEKSGEPPEAQSAAPQPQNTKDPSAQTAPAEPPKEAIREIVDRLQGAQNDIGPGDKALADTVANLVRQANDPLRLNQRSFHHEIAYVFQDVERKLGTQSLSPETRAEATRLATSAPGLENDRMLALMHSTSGLSDAGIIREIRRAGTEIGHQANQSTPAIRSQIDALENKVRLGPRPPEQKQDAPTPDQAADTVPGNEGEVEARHRAARLSEKAAEQPFRQGALDVALRGLRGVNQSSGAPWEPLPTPFRDRLNTYQNAMRAGRDDIAMRDVEKAGRAALNALEGFRAGEGATVMNRITAAARASGMFTVLSEMREGGRFQDLRRQFNTALKDEQGFARAYDKAATALAEYGEARTGIEQIIARRPDAANLAAKFEKLDAEIGEAAANTPSRREGKSTLDDVAKQAAEIVKHAVDSVQAFFNRNHNSPNTSGPSAAPG